MNVLGQVNHDENLRTIFAPNVMLTSPQPFNKLDPSLTRSEKTEGSSHIAVRDFATPTRSASKGPCWRCGLVCGRFAHGGLVRRHERVSGTAALTNQRGCGNILPTGALIKV